MSEENKATSPAEAPASLSDGKKGNVGLDAATVLMQQLTAKNIAALEKVKVAEPEVASPPPSEEETKEQKAEVPPSESESQPEAHENEPEEKEEDVLSQLELDENTKELLKTELRRQKERLHGKFQKRIDKEVGRKKSLESELQTLREQVAQVAAKPEVTPPVPPPYVNPNNPLSNIQDINTLNQEFAKAKEAMRLSEDLIAQAEDNGWSELEYQGQKFTVATLKAAHRNSRRIIEDYAPQHAQYLQTRHQQAQRAMTDFAWLKDRNSPEYVAHQRIKMDPDMSRRADADYMAAVIVEGLKAIESRKKTPVKESKPVSKPKAPVSQTEMGAVSAPSRQPDEEIRKSKVISEQQELNRKGNLNGSHAARFLLNREKLMQR